MKRDANSKRNERQRDRFHVIHKVPYGDSPYVKAKHAQVVEKDMEAAVVWFWKAINGGDRVESALKDMAVVMKQLDRTEEAIEAIRSFRSLCPKTSQDSLDNILIDLYKKCGRIDEQIEILKKKLRSVYEGDAFHGRVTKTARSHGKKFQVTLPKETSRILGNLGYAYMQKQDYRLAETLYKEAQMMDPDANKACSLTLCLIKQARSDEGRAILNDVVAGRVSGSDGPSTRRRVEELLAEIKAMDEPPSGNDHNDDDDILGLDMDFVNGLEKLMAQWGPSRSKRLPVFEEISSCVDQLVC
ncbi:PREDICTED: protein SULFUR DEFICIENCY-INDUCED 1-like [Tarenaya hassleriana]|uniref:protein SULFUR DEFICIENCY-INDUCED 1-like n=1 Tax=Tarenaya hassleriana TaxID=28532 RepID=UPI00053C46B9|nr:PREDICTED: protein SULFUR DEFICIENCY-INDUCED 1-like [Tarenaya hassleriana]